MASNEAPVTRMSNRNRVLSYILESPGRTRSEMSIALGLSRSAGSQIVTELVGSGVLREEADAHHKRPSLVGRPSTSLYPVMPTGVVLALDFGHRHVAVAAAGAQPDIDGNVHVGVPLARKVSG